MKKIISLNKVFLPLIISIFFFTNILCQTKLSTEKLTLLKVVAGINFTFKNYADEIWPGYNLSKEPYIAYMPNDFVLFVNGKNAPDGFEPYPSGWPDLGAKAFIHYGVYRNLIGQFTFNFQIDSIKTFAMGMPENLLFSFKNPSYTLLSTTIHEGFHQYQHNHFGEIPWAREELYPILDTENTALASLEMLILKDALNAMFNNNTGKMEKLVKEFAAVRNFRWKHADKYVRKYEQGQEINEGTARYVEMKAMDCFLKLDTVKIHNQLLRKIKADMFGMTIKHLLFNDMDARLTGLAVAPEDMLRNRIYPVGAALGFLLDRLNIDWKMKFQAAGSGISFPDLLIKYFKPDSAQLSSLLEKAKTDYHYPDIVSSAKNLINEYFAGYQNALKKFNRQKGIRIEINLSNNGLQRFRSTKNKKWTVDNGKKLLCLHFNLYSLKSLNKKKLSLETHDKAILDENDWVKRRKKVVFFANHVSSLLIDNTPVELTNQINRKFNKIKIEGDKFKFESEYAGTFSFKKNILVINLN